MRSRDSGIEASLTPDGRVRLVLPAPNFALINLALWTTGAALDWDERWFGELSGLSPAQVRSLNDEMKAVRYALEGRPSWISTVTGELVPPLEPRKTGTKWDELPKMEAENLPDGRVAVTLPREKFTAFPELLEASLVYVAPYRTESEESRFRGRFASSTEEVEMLRDELRRLGRATRGAT